jgi:hypothetical protein
MLMFATMLAILACFLYRHDVREDTLGGIADGW